jgi:glycine cleavage system regulatory protein
MTGLFIALGIAILTLIAILLWFVPHLLQQHTMQMAQEAAQLREIMGEMINEHEAVAMRQVQLGTSISYLQDQLEQIITIDVNDAQAPYMLSTLKPESLAALEGQMNELQQQIDYYVKTSRTRTLQSNESWAHLLALLGSMQERLRDLSDEELAAVVAAAPRNGQNGRYGSGELTGHSFL